MSTPMPGYQAVRDVPGLGLCGVHCFLYTAGLVVGIDGDAYSHRYCYARLRDAIAALEAWDGQGDPPGPWIKVKGLGQEERLGPGAVG